MKYSIKRYDRTVCIGHCKDKEPLSDIAIEKSIYEISKRQMKKTGDDGVTFRDQDYIGMLPGDVITFITETEAVTVQVYTNYDYTILNRQNRPFTISE